MGNMHVMWKAIENYKLTAKIAEAISMTFTSIYILVFVKDKFL